VSDRSPDRVTLAAFVLAVLFAGANGLAIGFSNDELAPYWGATLRFLAAGVVCAAIVARAGAIRSRAAGRCWGWRSTASWPSPSRSDCSTGRWSRCRRASGVVILALVPLLTLMLAVIQRVEPFRWLGVIGALVAATGVAIISADQLAGRVPPLPMLAVLLAAAAIAQSSVLIKRLPDVHPITTNAIAMLVGAAVLAAVSAALGEPWILPREAPTWVAIGYLVIIGTVVVYALGLFVLTRWTASSASYLHILLPLVAVPLGAWLRNERVSPLFAIGAAVVMVGVYVGVVVAARRVASEVVVPASERA
jgi:drug/metabolite transporter (DMT)-like permease